MVTHNKIVKLFRDIATNHYQINGFGFGNPYEYLAENTPDTVCMWGVLNPAQRNGRELVLSYSLLIFDLVKGDRGNEDEVLSDTQLIARDVISILESNTYDEFFKLSVSNQMEDFVEKFNSKVAGWKLDLSIRVPFERDICIIPSSGLPTLSGDYVQIIDLETGTVLENLSAGSSYYVVVASGIDEGNSNTVYTNQIVEI